MLNELMTRYPSLEVCKEQIEKAKEIIISAYTDDAKLMVCGNGGSCSDSAHIVGELMKGFLLKREVKGEYEKAVAEYADAEKSQYIIKNLQGSLPAIDLTAQSGIISAFANDVAPDMVYAQQVFGYGRKGDVLIGLTTSGNSANVVNAAIVAKASGMKVIAMTGEKPCKLDAVADVVIHVPETETFKVQELHLPVYHYLCAACEKHFFEK